MTCELCADTRYIGRQPALGPCICVTPETLREMQADLETADDCIGRAREVTARLLDANGYSARSLRIDNELLDELRRVLFEDVIIPRQTL